jgi:hypothetical protein
MRNILQRLTVLGLLLIFLIVPFKHIFLNCLHFTTHLVTLENPYHYHGSGNHGHDHNMLEILNHAVDDFNNEAQIPVELTGFKFQIPFPGELLNFPGYLPQKGVAQFYLRTLSLIPAPCKEVLLPPP